MKTNRLEWWETLIVVVAVALLGYALTSCSPKVLPIENTRTEWRDRIEWRDRLRIDSIYIHDSVYVSERLAGDTIYKDKVVYRNRERVVHDTINAGRVDSVRVVQTITRHVEVPAKLTSWQAWRLKAFAPLLAIAVALGAWVSRKLWLPLLRGLI
jgi:lipoprotein